MVTDFRQYIENNPDFVIQASKLFTLVDVNDRTLKLYEAENKNQLIDPIDKIISPLYTNILKQEFITIAKQKLYFENETISKILKENTISILIRVLIPEDLSIKNPFTYILRILRIKSRRKTIKNK